MEIMQNFQTIKILALSLTLAFDKMEFDFEDSNIVAIHTVMPLIIFFI